MKLFSNFRLDVFYGFAKDHPFLLVDAYTHTFTFVTIKDPRTEKGLTIALSFLKFRFNLAFYVDKPYTVKSKIMNAARAAWYKKE